MVIASGLQSEGVGFNSRYAQHSVHFGFTVAVSKHYILYNQSQHTLAKNSDWSQYLVIIATAFPAIDTHLISSKRAAISKGHVSSSTHLKTARKKTWRSAQKKWTANSGGLKVTLNQV